jgi:hypothetical protein
MKKLLILLVIFGGCATSERHVASESSEMAANFCELEKHAEKDWYRLKVKGEPLNEYWYSQNKAQAILDKHNEKGHCSQH